MKHVILFLLMACVCFAHAAELRILAIEADYERPLEQRLGGPAEWRMNTGDKLSLEESDQAQRLVTPQGATIIEFPAPESVQQVVASRTTSCLLLLVMTQRGGGFHSRLVRIIRDASGRWVAETLFPKDAPPMNTLHRWVSELGAISDSGRMVLMKLGEADNEEPPLHDELQMANLATRPAKEDSRRHTNSRGFRPVRHLTRNVQQVRL